MWLLFASLDKVALLIWGLLLKKKNLLLQEKFFSFTSRPVSRRREIWKGGKYENGRVASTENVIICLKGNYCISCTNTCENDYNNNLGSKPLVSCSLNGDDYFLYIKVANLRLYNKSQEREREKHEKFSFSPLFFHKRWLWVIIRMVLVRQL